jgi:hypothetical protein
MRTLGSQIITIAANIPVDQLNERMSAITRLFRSVHVVIRGNDARVRSVINTLSGKKTVLSARISLRSKTRSEIVSLRGDKPAG